MVLWSWPHEADIQREANIDFCHASGLVIWTRHGVELGYEPPATCVPGAPLRRGVQGAPMRPRGSRSWALGRSGFAAPSSLDPLKE